MAETAPAPDAARAAHLASRTTEAVARSRAAMAEAERAVRDAQEAMDRARLTPPTLQRLADSSRPPAELGA